MQTIANYFLEISIFVFLKPASDDLECVSLKNLWKVLLPEVYLQIIRLQY